MGINNSFGKFLFYCQKQKVNFENTLTLGRLKLYVSKSKLQQELTEMGVTKDLEIIDKDEYSERLFTLLGAKKTDAMDYSDYEQANIIHDLNTPLPTHLRNTYSVVLDSGTLEHVFNFPIAIKNCLEALKVGGHFIAITPSNNMLGHGFYQFSPELYFRILSPQNGFETELVLLGVCDESGEIAKWYRVADPNVIKQRVMLCNSRPAYLVVLARKVDSVDIFKQSPYQSDYVSTWENSTAAVASNNNTMKQKIKRILPPTISESLARFLHKDKYKTAANDSLGTYNPNHFKEFHFTENIISE